MVRQVGNSSEPKIINFNQLSYLKLPNVKGGSSKSRRHGSISSNRRRHLL